MWPYTMQNWGKYQSKIQLHIKSSIQDCGNSNAFGKRSPQSCTKPSIWWIKTRFTTLPNNMKKNFRKTFHGSVKYILFSMINPLAPSECCCNLEYIILKQNSVIDIFPVFPSDENYGISHLVHEKHYQLYGPQWSLLWYHPNWLIFVIGIDSSRQSFVTSDL